MKKIFNWTFGSVFRTFGRIIAYIIIGVIVSIILSNSDFRITDLFFDKVKATDFTSGFTDAYYSNSGRTNILTTHNAPTADYYGYEYSYNDGVNRYVLSYYNNFYFKTNITTTSQTNVMYIPVYMSSLSGTQVKYSLSTYIHDTRDNKYYACERISYAGSSELYSIIKCPFRKGAVIDKIETYAVFENANGINHASYYLNRFYTLEYEDNVQAIIDNQNQNNQNIINNQTNQTQQIIEQQQSSSNQTQETIINSTNQTISTITDNTSPDLNGTLDNNTIAGWLPAGPIDSIVTLPLTLLNSLFNAMGGTCADLTVPLPFIDSELSIPCMSKVYNSMSFSSFFNWIGIVASAFILYKYLLRLYKWIDATLTLRENTQVDWGGD